MQEICSHAAGKSSRDRCENPSLRGTLPALSLPLRCHQVQIKKGAFLCVYIEIIMLATMSELSVCLQYAGQRSRHLTTLLPFLSPHTIPPRGSNKHTWLKEAKWLGKTTHGSALAEELQIHQNSEKWPASLSRSEYLHQGRQNRVLSKWLDSGARPVF